MMGIGHTCARFKIDDSSIIVQWKGGIKEFFLFFLLYPDNPAKDARKLGSFTFPVDPADLNLPTDADTIAQVTWAIWREQILELGGHRYFVPDAITTLIIETLEETTTLIAELYEATDGDDDLTVETLREHEGFEWIGKHVSVE
jgi:hypothetical protein